MPAGKRSDIDSWNLIQSVPEPRSRGVCIGVRLLLILFLRRFFWRNAAGKRSRIVFGNFIRWRFFASLITHSRARVGPLLPLGRPLNLSLHSAGNAQTLFLGPHCICNLGVCRRQAIGIRVLLGRRFYFWLRPLGCYASLVGPSAVRT